jgi:hypothetical protein
MARLTLHNGLSWSALLIAAGLLVELGLAWSTQPLAFVAFLLLACPLVVAGMLLFLWTLASAER